MGKINKIFVFIIIILIFINTSLLFYYSVNAEDLNTEDINLMSSLSSVSIDGEYKLEYLKLYGLTQQVGTGTKNPNNPYSINGVSNPILSISEYGNVDTYALNTYGSLYKLPDGTKDEINYITGQKIQRVGIRIFNGSENWIINPDIGTVDTQRYYIDNLDNNLAVGTLINNSYTTHMLYNDNRDKIGYYGSTLYKTFTLKVTSQIATVQDLKDWLLAQYNNGTPFTVYYKLQNPVITNIGVSYYPVYSYDTVLSVSYGNIEYSIKFIENNVLTVLRSIDSKMNDLNNKADFNNNQIKYIFSLLIVFFISNIAFRGFKYE